MDFSAFQIPGRYRVYVEGIGCSYPLEIGADVWTRAFPLSMQGLLHHRSGIELGPPFTEYRWPRTMHPADGVQVFASVGTETDLAPATRRGQLAGIAASERRCPGPRELEEVLAEAPLAFVPLGTYEHHGFHLPVCFDGI